MRRVKFKGFALTLDVAIFVMCIALLFAAAIFGIPSYLKSARMNQAKADVAAFSLAVSRYAYDMENAYPDNTPGQCLPSSLSILESKDTDTGYGPWLVGTTIKKSGTSYLDPWGNEYVYTHGSGDDGRFVVYSKGPDGSGSVTVDGVVSDNGIGATGGYQK